MNKNLLYYLLLALLFTVCGGNAGAVVTLTGEAASATFAFSEGTDGQTATFNNSEWFLNSKVTYGEKLLLKGKDNKGNNQTQFEPTEKLSSASAANAIHFTFQPLPGLAFTPTKVSFKTTRYGTDGGRIDVAWENPNGTTKSLATNIQPPRDNATPSVGELSYTVSGATVAEGPCGLLINLYSLDAGKQVGFSDIVIEGTLSGTEREVPVLASFKANGIEYKADDVFTPDGYNYKGTIELWAADNMISASNPISDIVASKGTVGEVTYSGDNSKCTVTIPLSLDNSTVNYVATFQRRPFYTLTYINTDGTTMGTQKVEKEAAIGEFAVDFNKAKAAEGYKVRGWFVNKTVGQKYKTTDIITRDISLYAVATDIETASTHKKYTFDLTNQYFYPEDHDVLNIIGGAWHDNKHGWAFGNGDKIELLTGPKATITVGLCEYGSGTGITVTDKNGNTVGTMDGKAAEGHDGELAVFNYEGDAAPVTLTIEGSGEIYIHSVRIINTAEIYYDREGDWYVVKAGDADSFLDVIDAVNAANIAPNSPRAYIFLPDGTYDLRETVLTTITGHNVSLIGQSMNGTKIVNAPHYTNEGIGTTATIKNQSTGLYMQDLTLQNAMDYYGAIDAKLGGGRGVVLQEKGTMTIAKNVTLLSYQDTYYTNNADGKYYWETSDIHGTVDFFCGEGTMFYNNSTITVEKRNRDGKGGCTLTAPSTKVGNRYGYVFSGCKIVNYAENYNYGRAWSNEPRCAFINTTVMDSKLVSSRWTAEGMNVVAKEFVEYRTVDKNGNVVSPSSKVIEFKKGSSVNKMETILTASQAAEFALEKVYPDWNPAEATVQVAAPASVLTEDGVITWEAVTGAKAYAVFDNGKFAAIVEGTSYQPAEATGHTFTIRSANAMGGLGAPATVGSSALTSIEATEETPEVIYDLRGIRVTNPGHGLYIVNGNKVIR
ncbi:MAG: pectin esterase [Duncaniella sp.]|nr:pectin esterase [Duncaniella sp.]